jgi:nondiscriminating aspartyl-tRNA synthetase
MDAELGFIADHRDVLEVLTEVLRGMLSAVEHGAPAALDLLGVDTPTIPADVPVIHFSDALRSVGASDDEPDLAPEHERALGDWALKEFGSDVLAVEGYPMRKRPFYTCPQPGDNRWSNSFDLLFRGIELVTGGQRLHRYRDYISAIESRGEDPDQYHSYLQTFRHGMPPHGGFAIGLERWTARLIGASNIREVALFPRDVHRLTP